MQLEKLAEKIISGYVLTKDEALELYKAPIDVLKESASKITKHFFKDDLELCCISNGKCGKCSEDCKFCAQSRFYNTQIETSPLKTVEEFVAEAKESLSKHIHRYSIVTAGVRLSKAEIDVIAKAFKKIKEEVGIASCGSLGLLDFDDFVKLKESGMARYHCNIETSPNYFKSICTTHSMEDKDATIKAAKKAGLQICSGCIIGMGESVEDRVDIALHLRDLKVDSTPINILNPIAGTPLEHQAPLTEEEIERTIAVFRHILPKVVLRLAGGRLKIQSFYTKLYDFGINSQITGDMLTTAGLTVACDIHNAISLNKTLKRIDPL